MALSLKIMHIGQRWRTKGSSKAKVLLVLSCHGFWPRVLCVVAGVI